MYFKRLEMHGFKSFADPVIIDFHEGITCVVGPNGSGKSNISDAIRWVLGEQSPTALRGGKMDEVIFAGTANRKSKGMAEVVLVIDNSTRILDIDYSEVSITRRMFRSGESEYLINNTPCRLRDIRNLIMDTGIGVDGYSIIGQGKISDIVSTKPESRREIFEEAAGVVTYKTKRREAERKLESTTVNLNRINDIINEIEGRIDGLREDSIKAKEYLELKKKYESLEINVILRDIDNIQESAKAYKNEIEEIGQAIEKLTAEHSDIFAESGRLSERRELLDKLITETRDSILILAQEINDITNAGKLNEERMAGIESEKELISADLKNLNEMLGKEEANLEKSNKEEEELNQELSKAKEALQKEIDSYNEVAAKQSELAAKADEGRRNLFEKRSGLASIESEIKGMDNLKDNLLSRREELQTMSSTVTKDKENLATSLDEMEKSIKAEEEALEELKKKTAKLIEENNETRSKILEVNEEIARGKIDIGTYSARRHTLVELENSYEGYTFGVKTLLKEKRQGIMGVAGELMEVPKGYEIAMETAMGQAMQNIVCQRDQDAKEAIEFLKAEKAGRLTFLPIESIKGGKEFNLEPLKGDDGYIDIAENIATFDEKYRGIYSYLLGRVAVVKDLDSAIRLSKKGTGLRFVTLSGEIINAAGAITGGTSKNKPINVLERRTEIRELAEKLEELEKTLKEKENELERLNGLSEDYISRITAQEEEKHSKEINLSSMRSAGEAARERYEREMDNDKRIASELLSITEQLTNADNITSDQKKQMEELSLEIENLNKEIEEAINANDEARDLASAMSEKVTRARIAVNEIETKVDGHNELAQRIINALDSFKRQITSKKEAMEELEAEKEGILNATVDGEALNLKLSEREGKETSLKTLTSERDEIIEKQKQIETDQSGAQEKINDYRDQRYQLEIKSAKGETRLESMKEKLWEEFEISYAQAEEMRAEDFVYSRALKDTREIRARIRELGDVNIGSIEEYDQVSERYSFLTEQRADVVKAMDELNAIIREMDTTIKEKFKDNFDKVVINFEAIFKELFGGGQAELRMEDENDPLNSGIEIVAQPPGKKLQNINLMSGGEKTMTAIALMFAVLKTKPTPFCILDEVEAALDDTNIDRFANYLKNFQEIQFTLVTHQKATMEHADVLYGVTMPEHGISKVLSLRLGDDFDLGEE